jgi:hypothetical protein
MPNMEELGTRYTSFPIHFGGEGGYEVRTIAVENDTDVTVPAFSTSETLNMGEFHTADNTVTELGFTIHCSKPCMVVQYMRNLPMGGNTDTYMSMFLTVLTPDDNLSNNLVFTVPTWIGSADGMGALSIIVDTYPVTGLHLNDTSLADLDWQPLEDSTNWVATLEIEHGFYQMYSSVSSER